MELLRRVHGVTLRDKERSREIRTALNVEPLLQIERFQLLWSAMCPERPTKDWRGMACNGPEVVQLPGGVRPVYSQVLRLSGAIFLFLLYVLIKNVLGATKIGRHKKLGGIAPEYIPVVTGLGEMTTSPALLGPVLV